MTMVPSKWVESPLWPFIFLAVFFLAALAFRPLLPVDETRYMTVAWEMHLRGDWLAPLTVNFLPYHHKPPLLFWLINGAWEIFGISRWAGLVPIFIAAALCLFLTRKLAENLFPERNALSKTVPFLLLGSVPFLIYGSLVMFDVTLTVFVLLSLLSLIAYAESGKARYILALALAMGLGVLTKGPVAWLYVIFPLLTGPLWMRTAVKPAKWYGGCGLALLLSVIPVGLWLIPVLSQSSDQFAFWLVWEQTAGRVTGSFNDAHVHPVWFFVPLVPVMFLPWLFFPSFWRGAVSAFKVARYQGWPRDKGVRFLLLWVMPVFVAFSLISGKQPHYLLPLLPGVVIGIALLLETVSARTIAYVSMAMVFLFIAGQGVASRVLFPQYDVQVVADYVHDHQDHDWAFVRKYHGELTFLGRLEKTLDSEQFNTIDDWFAAHPDGKAVIRYGLPEQVAAYDMVLHMPYRSRQLGIFKAKAVKTP